MNEYAKQDRGDLSAYEEYFAGMDASMQQKIALTTAHFPVRGRIADMGSGSGSGTFDLARLYRGLEIVGVDINPVTVEYSRSHYRAENLFFETGDIADRVFPEASLDGILDSSVLHHVTSFNGFDVRQIARTIENQVAQLRAGGVLIIRDFVVPDDAGKQVFLDLPTTDGKDSGAIPELSTAALFDVFARDFRSSVNLNGPVEYRKLSSPRDGFVRFAVTLRTAAEFVLRKDYRDHWTPELLEEYTYCSQRDFEELFRKNGLRIVVSMPLWNPWIVSNRFAGKFFLSDAEENPLVFPPTNFLIVGEKIGEKDGCRIGEAKGASAPPAFLRLTAYRHRATGQIYELVTRPNRTIDLLPWFETAGGQLFVLAKKDFPRPLVNAQSQSPQLNRAAYSGYLTEPISAISDFGFRNPDSSVDEAAPVIREILGERAGLGADEVLEIGEPRFYFTSPGGIDERVESFLVRIAPFARPPREIENYTPFTSAGTVRELDALQVLRASHVGGMFDARLEINIYRLLRHLNRSAGAWIGAALAPAAQKLPANFEIAAIGELSPPPFAAFEPVEAAENRFLDVVRSEFVETDAAGRRLASAVFEYVVPRKFSKNTVAAIPFVKTENAIFVGVETRDLPAPQTFTGSSRLRCAPAWRLPRGLAHKFGLEEFLRERFPKDFGAAVRRAWELGGSYFTSAGVTPEVVYPFAVELDAARGAAAGELRFFRLDELLAHAGRIGDAHFLILLNRLGHALGSLSKETADFVR
ncbi:MAG: methyltransferase domain-containing protein [Acidobacteria bacterium]|nr:methyltransferase domain-containing protein [Acidobacteriota bacterium]